MSRNAHPANAHLPRPVNRQTPTLVSLVGLIALSLWHQKIFVKRKEMIRQSRAEKFLGRVEKGVHLLEKGIAVGHDIYRVGQALAPLAAAMV